MHTRVGHQVRLELVEVDVQGTVKAQAGRDRADNLSNQTVKMLVRGTGDIEVPLANIVDSLVIDEECAVGVLDGRVSAENGIVRFDDGVADAGSRVDGELELGLLAVVVSEPLEEESTESGAGTTTEGVVNQETLKAFTRVWERLERKV